MGRARLSRDVRQHMRRFTAACILLFSGVANAQSGGSDLEKFVASIKSVAQVKQEIKQQLSETCGTGTCFNNNATAVCSYVGALDVRLNNLITSTSSSFTPKPELPITEGDLHLMKRIWRQCKPSNYQFWNYGQMLHVMYDADPKEDIEIRKALGIKQ